jgi:mannose-6-phosphate isomerase
LELLGRRGQADGTFPLLTKWLDCHDWLSVQVHPDDALAREFTGDPAQRGKSEAWFIAHCEAEASLIHGLAEGFAPSDLSGRTGAEVLPYVRHLKPTPDTLLFTGAGTVHALGPGLLIYEVQQSSDLTYRFYDWGRDRPLHPERSQRCLMEARTAPHQQDERGLRCRYFEIETFERSFQLNLEGESFNILASVTGTWELEGQFNRVALGQGGSVLLPANLGPVTIHGRGRMLKIGLGDGKP